VLSEQPVHLFDNCVQLFGISVAIGFFPQFPPASWGLIFEGNSGTYQWHTPSTRRIVYLIELNSRLPRRQRSPENQ
jgi:hypothetical protein